jgi:hypothetical protein
VVSQRLLSWEGREEMKATLVAKLDRKGSECAKCWHYVFGRKGADVSGGIYILKTEPNPPDFIEIEIPQVKGE